MTSWKRITFVVFVLIGGAMAFSYWSFNQFNKTFSNLEATITANMLLASASFEKKTESASISPETSEVLATSTDETTSTHSTDSGQATTPVATASVDLELSLTFPQKGDEIYIGCTYPISWQSSTTINLLETVLVDTGTKQPAGPVASGLAKENIIEKDLQNLSWKVGIVWPGAYYIKVSKINGTDAEIRSNVFTISKIPQGTNTAEQEKICKKSGGLF